MTNSIFVHESFSDLMEQKVLPSMPDRPEKFRLNGQNKDSKKPPKILGYFRGDEGEVFKLHDDSLYVPLLLAYAVYINGGYPFVKKTTKDETITLELRNDLQQLMSINKKGFYAYKHKVSS